MEYVTSEYDEDELAWVSPKIQLSDNAFLTVCLVTPGKLVVRQDDGNGRMPRVPISQHPDTTEFKLRLKLNVKPMIIQIFTSTQPKEIKYAYI